MKKKWVRYSVIALGAIVLLLVLANFGLNYWLQNNLPSYIKKNTEYKITYKTLNVDIATGNILSTALNIENTDVNNAEILGLEGTIDTLQIGRLGIYDAIFNKKINSSDLLLVNPTLKIKLAKAKDAKEKRKKSSVLFRNIKIKNGEISIFKNSKSKYFSVQKLFADIKNIELVDRSENKLLPIEFDEQQVSGENFYFRPDNSKLVKARKLHTEDGLLSVNNIEIVPLLSYAQFAKYYPKKNSYFQGKISKLELKDFIFKKGKIKISTVKMEQPEIKLFTYQKTIKKDKKPFDYMIALKDLKVNKASFQIYKEANDLSFSSNNLNLSVFNIELNEKTAKNKIPFSYDTFTFAGKNVQSTLGDQNLTFQSFTIDPLSAVFSNLLLRSAVKTSQKSSMDGSIRSVDIKIKEWNFDNEKLKLDVETVVVDGFNGNLHLGKNKTKKKKKVSGIEFPLLIRKISLKNSNLELNSGKEPLYFKNLNAVVNNVEMNAQTVKNKTPFKIGSYQISSTDFKYRISQFYDLSAGNIQINNKYINLRNIVLKPLQSRAQFVRSIPVERDLYDLKISQLTANGTWDFLSDEGNIDARNVNLNGMNANIFRSKIPKDDLSVKLLYSSMLKTIKFPLFIGDLNINNSTLVYEEDTPKSDGPGKLVFGNFNLNAKNINSGRSKGKPTKIPIVIKCLLMNTSPLTVNWSFDTAATNDQFTISGYTGQVDAPRLNQFIEPYLKIRATGEIDRLTFNFNGNKSFLNGTFKMEHTDLKVEVLNKEGEKDKLISAVANLVVKTNSGKFPPSVLVENVERDKTKSFFNFLWRGLEEGLKKTLIGIGGSSNSEPSVKDISKPGEIKSSKKQGIEAQKKTEKKEEKKGFFQRIFNKKEKAEK